MVDITTRSVTIGDEPVVSGASWGAIFAGAAVSLAVTLAVVAFGVGLGLSVVSPWENAGISATTFKIGSGLFLIVVAMLSSSLGGYIAGRLHTRWVGVHTDEVFFRDTAHGFATWAVATVIGFGVLAAPSTSLLGGAASGAMQGATTAAASGPSDLYTDQLLRSSIAPVQQAGGAQQNGTTDSRGEINRLLTASMQSGGNVSAGDRTYLVQIVAARTGLSQADAEKRVSEVTAKAKSDIDAARKAAAQLSFWLVASLVIGAFCSSIAAAEGGALRDGFKTWRRI